MGRPKIRRIVHSIPKINFFTPRGNFRDDLSSENLTIAEFEALRLKHYEKMTQNNCAKKMNVSQSTFSRILEEAHIKITRALVEGKGILLSGGTYGIREIFLGYGCADCMNEWTIEFDQKTDLNIADNEKLKEILPLKSDLKCPKCNSGRVFRLKKDIIT
ncbi:MAG: DUF134 domain-containing protein [Promethearchaeota archaeon]